MLPYREAVCLMWFYTPEAFVRATHPSPLATIAFYSQLPVMCVCVYIERVCVYRTVHVLLNETGSKECISLR